MTCFYMTSLLARTQQNYANEIPRQQDCKKPKKATQQLHSKLSRGRKMSPSSPANNSLKNMLKSLTSSLNPRRAVEADQLCPVTSWTSFPPWYVAQLPAHPSRQPLVFLGGCWLPGSWFALRCQYQRNPKRRRSSCPG